HRDEAGWWTATSPEVPGMVTQARRLDQLADRAREAIALVLDIEPDHVGDVELIVAPIGADVEDAISHYRQARVEADRALDEISTASRTAARALTDCGLSVRDAGWLLELS